MDIDPANQIREILDGCTAIQRSEIVRLLRMEYRSHVIEEEWNTSAEVVLEALARSSALTKRMFKGILAEAACKIEVIDKLEGWRDVTLPGGGLAHDFVVERGGTTVTVQAKLQRKLKHKPMFFRVKGQCNATSNLHVVETQKTRSGKKKSGEKTRPYSFGEFDILAVSVEPATRDWSQFRFTVGNWLIPRPENPILMAVLQPVSLIPNEDWTDSLPIAIEWFQSGRKKTISTEWAAEGT